MDFSKPVNSSQNSIDISTDNITTDIHLPVYIDDGALFISDGVMHMLLGVNRRDLINVTAKVWNFNLKTQKLDAQDSGIRYQPVRAAIAFDTEKQVGWYYGGIWQLNHTLGYVEDLYRLDRGKGTPTKVEVNSSIGAVDGGELVYLKNIGNAGALVLIGGEIGPANTAMRQIDIVHVFDIATNTWFTQRTTAQEKYPGDRVDVCSVVASAWDNSSHNIYMYGGYDRNDIHQAVTNEIFILTLPAFHWILVRADCGGDDCDIWQAQGHKCQKVHEKYMVAYRGFNFEGRCDNDPVLKKFQGMTIYDMSSLTWTTKIELENQKYLVPDVLHRIIGGNAMGNATITAPGEGFQDPKLGKVFTGQAVNKTTPITILPPIAGPRGDKHTQGRLPVGAIAGGIVVFVLFIATAFLLRRRQQRLVEIPEMTTSIEPQEMQDCGIQELHDPKHVPELPTLPIELCGSIPKIELDS